MIRSRHGSDHLGTLSIGALPIELHGAESFLIETIENRYGAFLTSDLGDLSLALGILDRERVGSPAYAPSARYKDRVLTMQSEVLEAKIDFATGSGTIDVVACASASEYYLENALRQIV